jgi:hypothetical protein
VRDADEGDRQRGDGGHQCAFHDGHLGSARKFLSMQSNPMSPPSACDRPWWLFNSSCNRSWQARFVSNETSAFVTRMKTRYSAQRPNSKRKTTAFISTWLPGASSSAFANASRKMRLHLGRAVF